MINLGDKVRDRVSGLEGIVVARTNWLNGCIRFTIQPQELKDGKPVDTSWFDIEDMELVRSNVLSPKTRNITNGPMPPAGGSR